MSANEGRKREKPLNTTCFLYFFMASRNPHIASVSYTFNPGKTVKERLKGDKKKRKEERRNEKANSDSVMNVELERQKLKFSS